MQSFHRGLCFIPMQLRPTSIQQSLGLSSHLGNSIQTYLHIRNQVTYHSSEVFTISSNTLKSVLYETLMCRFSNHNRSLSQLTKEKRSSLNYLLVHKKSKIFYIAVILVRSLQAVRKRPISSMRQRDEPRDA